jgi:hypothetical protein
MQDLINALYTQHPPTTQRECCALAVRVAQTLTDGPVEDRLIRSAASGLARGLFGPAFDGANEEQQTAWIDLVEDEYRARAFPE